MAHFRAKTNLAKDCGLDSRLSSLQYLSDLSPFKVMTAYTKNTSTFVLLLFFGLFNTSCTFDSDQEKIADAQACLDKATSTTARACLARIEGVTQAKAYGIRCSVEYIERGFDDLNKLIGIFGPISGGEGSTANPLVSAMAGLAFDTRANAQLTQSYCTLSNSPGLVLLSSFSVMATVVGGASGILDDLQNPNISDEDKQAALEDAWKNLSQEEDKAVIGQTAKGLAAVYCAGEESASDPVCADMQQAIGANESDEVVGEKLSCIMSYSQEQLAGTDMGDPVLVGCRLLLAP